MTLRGLDFKPIKPTDIPPKATGTRPSRYVATIGEFARSGVLAVEVDCGAMHAHSVANMLGKAIGTLGLKGRVVVKVRAGRVFVERVRA